MDMVTNWMMIGIDHGYSNCDKGSLRNTIGEGNLVKAGVIAIQKTIRIDKD